MGHLWALIQEYLDRQGGMSQAALARKMGTSPQTLGSWKKRGSRPEPDALRALAVAIEQPYEVVHAALEADQGYLTDEELEASMRGRGLSAEVRERLRAHVGRPMEEPAATRRRGAQ
jgi:transcriptional regulator with XRE-family HTH domain